MPTKLRLLIIEDSEDDALLLVRELSKKGYELLCERVDTPEAMKAGASDYIIKGNLARLTPAIEREIGEVEVPGITHLKGAA